MLVSLALDYRRARLEVRERFHLEDDDVPRVYRALRGAGVEEAVLARTCNRIEAYCWWSDSRPLPLSASSAATLAPEIARAWGGEDAQALMASATVRDGSAAPPHLLRVAAGLESQVLGDIHILGQLRRAFRDAVEADMVGSHLHRLFETAFRVGKKVKRETQLMTTRSGVGSEAARRAMSHWGDLRGRKCVVLGCGKSGAQAARSLYQLGAADLHLVNRTLHRAEKLARDLGGARAMGLEALPALLGDAEVVIVATGAQEPVLTRELLYAARRDAVRPMLVIDVSVPRNVDVAVGRLEQVSLVDLDGLHPEAAAVEKSRLGAVPEAESLVAEGVRDFHRWLELKPARHALRPLQSVLAEICRREVAFLVEESGVAERAADRIVARVMAHPMTTLRLASELGRGEVMEEAAGALGTLFADPRAA